MEDKNRARSSAQSTLQHIQALHQLHSVLPWDMITQLRALPPAGNKWMSAVICEIPWDDLDDKDDLREHIEERVQEMPLSVTVRSGWHTPGASDNEPEEFCILMSTGGPAVRIYGELDHYKCPYRPQLQGQDWFTPWETFNTSQAEDEALKWFCGCFYFGEYTAHKNWSPETELT